MVSLIVLGQMYTRLSLRRTLLGPVGKGTAGRRALVKLRISNHKLTIEIGRYNQTTKDTRHCPFCGCNVMEDEVHFLFQCRPTYSMIRNEFYCQDSDSKYYPVTYRRFDQ